MKKVVSWKSISIMDKLDINPHKVEANLMNIILHITLFVIALFLISPFSSHAQSNGRAGMIILQNGGRMSGTLILGRSDGTVTISSRGINLQIPRNNIKKIFYFRQSTKEKENGKKITIKQDITENNTKYPATNIRKEIAQLEDSIVTLNDKLKSNVRICNSQKERIRIDGRMDSYEQINVIRTLENNYKDFENHYNDTSATTIRNQCKISNKKYRQISIVFLFLGILLFFSMNTISRVVEKSNNRNYIRIIIFGIFTLIAYLLWFKVTRFFYDDPTIIIREQINYQESEWNKKKEIKQKAQNRRQKEVKIMMETTYQNAEEDEKDPYYEDEKDPYYEDESDGYEAEDQAYRDRVLERYIRTGKTADEP